MNSPATSRASFGTSLSFGVVGGAGEKSVPSTVLVGAAAVGVVVSRGAP